MATKLSFTTDKKEIGSIINQIDNQYITVGEHLQKFLLSKKQEEGKEVKNVREYMESQRSYVWESWRASNLIQSILLQHPIPAITMYRNDSNSKFRKVLDGQQRLTTIYLFINDQFKLDMSNTIFPEFTIEGENFSSSDLQGKTFSELPKLWQDIITGYDLSVTTMNDCTEEEAEKYFVSMNAGQKALKAAEVRTAAMGLSTRKFFRTALKSDWVLHAMTEKASTSNTGNEILSQVITLLHNNCEPLELSKNNIDNIIYSFRDSGIPEAIKTDILSVCDYLNRVTNIWIENKKKLDAEKETKKGKKVSNYSTYRFTFLNKTNTIMLMISAIKAIKNNITVEQFADWAYKFFADPTGEYKDGLQDKAIDLKRVSQRLNGITKEIERLSKEAIETITEPIEEIKEESNNNHIENKHTKPVYNEDEEWTFSEDMIPKNILDAVEHTIA